MRDYQVREMFENIAFSYDFQNSFLSLRMDVGWRKVLARMARDMAATREAPLFLDAAVGTAEVALELLRQAPGSRVLGVDFSPAMLGKARDKTGDKPVKGRLSLSCGDCRALPLADASVDAATMAFGIRNIHERVQVLREIHRSLRPGGGVLVMEFGIPENPVLGKLYRWYFAHILPPVGNWLSRTDYAYSYLVESVDAFPTDAAFLAEIREAGFTETGIRNLTFGVAKIFHGRKEKDR